MSEQTTTAGDVAVVPWWRAAPLTERASWTRAGDDDTGWGQRVAGGGDAAERHAFWRELWWVDQQPETVATRVAALGVGEEEFRALLDEPSGAPVAPDADRPAWLRRIEAAARDDAGRAHPEADLGLLEPFRAVLVDARHRLRRDLAALPVPPQLRALDEVLLDTMPLPRLWEAVSRTLVLELNVARLEGRLTGDTPEERFAAFVELLRTDEVRQALWTEYPVLLRYVTELCEQWVARAGEFGRRLAGDWGRLRDAGLLPAEPGALTEVSFGAGDVHRDGQSVALLRFEDARLVYKPRSLRADLAYNGLLDWFNAHGPRHALRTVRVLDRGEGADGYGWAEFVASAPCADRGEVRAFYWRMGAQLALLYALHATDMHFENVIASGPHPVVVDLEALFHTVVSEAVRTQREQDWRDPAQSFLETSVALTGLLPGHMLYRDEDDRVQRTDMSGIGGEAGQLTPAEVPGWVGIGTDEMRLVKQRQPMEGFGNAPRLGDAPVDARDHRADVVAGFRDAYRILLAGRSELLAPEGVLAGFADAPFRVIFRATRLYGQLLTESLHPDFLRDARDRDVCLDRLWGGLAEQPGRGRIIQSEIAQLLRGNVPLFDFVAAERAVRLGDGSRVEDFFDEAPYDRVARRIAGLGERDLEQQVRVIESSYLSQEMALTEARWPGWSRRAARDEVRPGQLVAAAAEIGDRLLADAIGDGTRDGWLSLNLLDERIWTLGTTGMDLYGGLPGIGLFLGQLGKAAGHAGAARAAERAADELTRRLTSLLDDAAAPMGSTGSTGLTGPTGPTGPDDLERNDPDHELTNIGAGGPLAGPLYFLSALTALTGEDRWLPAIDRIIALLPRRSATDPHLDVVNGSAGAVLTLLAAHESLGDPAALTAATQVAERLLTTQVPAEDGHLAWPSKLGASGRPLAGFSHGAAGGALALMALNSAAPDARYGQAAARTLRFEQTLFDPVAGNWRDVRDVAVGGRGEGTFMNAWCHGAPGIGLARLALLRHGGVPGIPDADLRAQLNRAVSTTLAAGLEGDTLTGVGNHSLCHGDLGNLELVRAYAEFTSDADLAAQVRRTLRTLLDAAGTGGGWLCGVPLGAPTPGLMTGLAGIGHALLRAAAPERTGSVLLFEAARP
ncbi:type 2 lanthipeptide synthetase LanM family protein [Streptomyces sp. NPDC059009]|uniref:type 2 lanthipeptide synthetase LanM family protein n=1 Tax=Streptomyces sp. NPDC059009 TaxID=3346694 RepID=UPI00367E4BBC